MKPKLFKSLLLTFSLLTVFTLQPVSAQETERSLLLTHYMPWYQTPAVSGYWGWHWTMNHFNPSNVDENGRPEFASHYMPLTGLYDSQDPAVLEYQVLLMKLGGMDGVVVDWYGTAEHNDYPAINAATGALFEYVERAGLRFVICYEDRTIRTMLDEEVLSLDETHAQGQADILHVQENWFSSDAYVTHEGQPLLFVYGPVYFRQPSDWETIFSALETPASLVTLDGHMDWAALSGYPWPPMSMAGGATLAPAVLESYLELFYRNARRQDFIVGSAFPQFHDIYAEADVRSSYGFIDPQNGDTFRMTIDLALAANANIIQLVTWNDYGEGTIIEPTEETGYQYLEIVQETRRTLDAEFVFAADDLQLPLRLFNLRRELEADADAQARLDEVFEAIVAGDLETANTILTELE